MRKVVGRNNPIDPGAHLLVSLHHGDESSTGSIGRAPRPHSSRGTPRRGIGWEGDRKAPRTAPKTSRIADDEHFIHHSVRHWPPIGLNRDKLARLIGGCGVTKKEEVGRVRVKSGDQSVGSEESPLGTAAPTDSAELATGSENLPDREGAPDLAPLSGLERSGDAPDPRIAPTNTRKDSNRAERSALRYPLATAGRTDMVDPTRPLHGPAPGDRLYDHPITPPVVASTMMDALFQDLQSLTETHVLFYRLQIGQRLLDVFYNGDVRLYWRSRENPGTSWNHFVNVYHAGLRTLGLSTRTLRDCLKAASVRTRLQPLGDLPIGFSHLLELSAVESDTLREALALRTVENGWSVRVLREAVQTATSKPRKSRVLVPPEAAPGEQRPATAPNPDTPPAPPSAQSEQPPTRPHRPSVYVRQLVTATTNVARFGAQLRAVEPSRLKSHQCAQLRSALHEARGEIERLESILASLPPSTLAEGDEDPGQS
jgi:hypothetical protein